MDSAICTTRDAGNIVTLTMDAPGKPVNTCTTQFLADLSAAIDELDREQPSGLIVTSAKSGSFNAGADLFEVRTMSSEQLGEFLARGQALFDRIARLPFPTVAAINGDCLGGGFELALACRKRVAADSTSISIGLPEVKLGLIPAWGGSTRLPRLIGLRAALPILLAGKTMPPRKAVKAGLVDETVRPEALGSAAKRLVRSDAATRDLSMIDRTLASVSLARNRLFASARHKTLKETHGNYPAPMALLDVIETGYENDFAAGLVAEREAILRVTATDAGRNLLRLFFLRQGAKKEAMSSLHAKPATVNYAAVIGGGTMGAGIVHALARAGIFVRLVEVSAAAVSSALGRIRKMLEEDVATGRLDRLAARDVFNRVSPTIDWSGLEMADFVIEAVNETIEAKREVFSRLDRLTRPTAVLASNTSSLKIADIAEATLHPNRVVGLHFFNPVPKMPLVEIVRAPQSDDASLATAVALAGRIGKTPVLVSDAAGFVVNRVLVPYLAESLVMASEGVPITAIDSAMKAWGMPMGPFELLDEIGLDIAAHVLKSLEHGAPPPPNVVEMFELATKNRWLGKKRRRGFYMYKEAKPRGLKVASPNKALLKTLNEAEHPEAEFTDESIQRRLVLPMVNEAAKLLEEHVTDSADTIDLATVFGLGLAPFRGGIIQYANTVGTDKIVEQLEELAVEFGQRFTPTWLLCESASAHRPLGSALPAGGEATSERDFGHAAPEVTRLEASH